MNKRSLFSLAALCSVCLVLILSCDKKIGKYPVAVALVVSGSACDTVTYTKQIKALIDLKCGSGSNGGCHAGPFPSGGVPLTDYTQVKTQADNNRIKARVIDHNPSIMPQSPETPLTQAQLDLLQCWLNNGKKQ